MTTPTYYDKHKHEVQKKRLITALDKLASQDFSGRKPSLKSLTKYGLYDPKTKTITIPTHLKPPKLIYSSIPEPEEQPIIQVVRNYDSVPVEKFDLSKADVNGKSIRDWIYTDLSAVAMKTMKVRGGHTLALYANVAENLCKIRNEPYDDTKNVFSYFNDPTTTIAKAALNPTWKAAGTKAKFLSGVLFLAENYPKLKGYISQDVLDTYDAEYKRMTNLSKAEQKLANLNKVYFTWDVIKDEVLSHYGYKTGHASYEALLILLFNAAHGRDDFGCRMAYKVEDVKTGLTEIYNYLYLDRSSRVCRLYMNAYKTAGSYKNQVITLDKKLSDLIIKLHPDDTAKTLFPPSIGKDAQKIGSFLIKTMKAIPLFEKEGINIKYLRHSIVSTALLHIDPKDPNYTNKLADLAEKTYHSVNMQQNTYKSRLKDKNGKEILIPPVILKEYDSITTVMLGDDGTVEEGEEAGTTHAKKPKPKPKQPVKKIIPKLRPPPKQTRKEALKEIAEEGLRPSWPASEGGGDSDEVVPNAPAPKKSEAVSESTKKPASNLRRGNRHRRPTRR